MHDVSFSFPRRLNKTVRFNEISIIENLTRNLTKGETPVLIRRDVTWLALTWK